MIKTIQNLYSMLSLLHKSGILICKIRSTDLYLIKFDKSTEERAKEYLQFRMMSIIPIAF